MSSTMKVAQSETINTTMARTFSSKKKSSMPDYMEEYLNLFEKSNAIDRIIPRKVEDHKGLPFLESYSDLDAVNKGLLAPMYHLLDLGGKRWRPVYGMIAAESFGMDVRDIKGNSVLYYLLASGELIHNASLLIDDIEDKSLKRRGDDCAYIKFGTDVVINEGNFAYFMPLARLGEVVDPSKPLYAKLLTTMAQELAALHYGQNWDIMWHNSSYVPTKKQYFQMTVNKTGVIPRMITKLICELNSCPLDKQKIMLSFTDKMGIGFQIKDDIIAVESEDYAKARGILCEDIHEGKKSLMVIHALTKNEKPIRDKLAHILSIGTTDNDLIAEALEIIKKGGSVEYAREVSEEIMKESYKEVDEVITHPEANRKFKELGNFLVRREI